ncbi:MAG: AAA family ATPase [Enhygromyxa sp.]
MSGEAPRFGYFYSLGVKDSLCFGPAQTLELHDDEGRVAKWTVILGDNGVGKTSLLQCLYAVGPWAKPNLEPGDLYGTLTRSASWSNWPGRTRRTPFEALSRAGAAPELRANVSIDTPLGRPLQRWLRVGQAWGTHGPRGSQHPDIDFTMFICGYGAGRKPGSAVLAESNVDDDAATLFDERATLLGAEEWFLQSDYAAKSLATEDARVRAEAIRETLIDLLPDVEELEVVGLDRQPPRPALSARTPYGWVSVGELSLGYRTLMAWVIDFAARMFARYPDSKNPLTEPAVCLVDEIDLHLHPTWQRKLIAFLDQRFTNTQFIVTAHSPLVVQAAEHANIAVLRRHEGEDFVTIHNDLDAVRGWRVDQILTSDLFGLDGSRAPRANELLRERATLLGKSTLEDADRRRIAELDEQLASLPHGDSKTDQDAWDIVRRFAQEIERAGHG